MKNHPRHDDRDETKDNLRKLLGDYSLNKTSGIYQKTISEDRHDTSDKVISSGKPKAPFYVKVKTDWPIVGISMIISAFTLIGLGATVYFTHKQWKETQRSAVAAEGAVTKAQAAIDQGKKQFEQDQRPYVWVTSTGAGSPEFHPTPNTNPQTGQIIWSWHYTNYGKAPALWLQHTDHEIRLGIGPRTRYAPFVRSYQMPERPYRKEVGPLLPINKDDFATVVSGPGITPAEWNQFLQTDYAISIRVRIQYADYSGVIYETSICETRLAGGAIQYCDEDNYIKGNPAHDKIARSTSLSTRSWENVGENVGTARMFP